MAMGAIKKFGEKGVVTLNGNFDYHCIREFKNLYEPLLKDVDITSIEVNMGGVDYIDYMALGMLLSLRDKACGSCKKVILGECQGMTKRMLDVANFEKIFEIV